MKQYTIQELIDLAYQKVLSGQEFTPEHLTNCKIVKDQDFKHGQVVLDSVVAESIPDEQMVKALKKDFNSAIEYHFTGEEYNNKTILVKNVTFEEYRVELEDTPIKYILIGYLPFKEQE